MFPIPTPLLIVVCIIGAVVAGIVAEAVISIVRNITVKRANKTPPLSTCEMTATK
jgi:uncharacterized integral membrane protein